MIEFPKCECGRGGTYMNMIAGQFITTCREHGCIDAKPVTLYSSSSVPLNSDQWLAKHGRDFIG